MKIQIKDASPDGLLITFTDSFYFDTYDDAVKFIKGVKQLEINIHQEARRRSRMKAIEESQKGDKT